MSQNFLSNLKFEMLMARLPETTFMVQSLSLPGISANPVMRQTPFVTTPIPGDHVDFSSFTIQFAVEGDLKNYLEIFNWMKALYFPDNYDEYSALSHKNPGDFGLISDITLRILDHADETIQTIIFHDAFPISLSELAFTYQTSDMQPITSAVQFSFRNFDFVT